MERTPEDQLAAIIQIREYAAGYVGKRREFYAGLHGMLATPIRDDGDYQANVRRMYLAAIGALTAEIEPPTSKTYDTVLDRLNSALDGEKLGPVQLAFYPDEAMRQDYAVPGAQGQKVSFGLGVTGLQDALPSPRKLSKANQALVDRFRAELPDHPRPFAARGAQRG
jgi:hypothetical protein